MNYPRLIKVLIFSIIVFGATALVFYKSVNLRSTTAETESPTVEATKSDKPSVFSTALLPVYAEAKSLKIPSVKIEANIVSVGLDQGGSMETPTDWYTAGWYNKGARPGEKGNLIINGHYDTNTGKAASFYNLRNTKVADIIEVIDDYDKTYKYAVSEVFYIGINDPDRLEIFKNDESKNELTIITCGGVWDSINHNYSKRLVVKGYLVKI